MENNVLALIGSGIVLMLICQVTIISVIRQGFYEVQNTITETDHLRMIRENRKKKDE